MDYSHFISWVSLIFKAPQITTTIFKKKISLVLTPIVARKVRKKGTWHYSSSL